MSEERRDDQRPDDTPQTLVSHLLAEYEIDPEELPRMAELIDESEETDAE